MNGTKKPLQIYTDGASRGNPGPGAWAFLFVEEGRITRSLSGSLVKTTNNNAEYQAILKAMSDAISIGYSDVEIYSDSELVIKQIRGEYSARQGHLADLLKEVRGLVTKFNHATFNIIKRNNPFLKQADMLCNHNMDENVISPPLHRLLLQIDTRQKKYREALTRNECNGRLLLCIDNDFFSNKVTVTSRIVSHFSLPADGLNFSLAGIDLSCKPTNTPGWSQEIRFRNGNKFNATLIDWSIDYIGHDSNFGWDVVSFGSLVRYMVKGQEYGLSAWVEPDRIFPNRIGYPIVLANNANLPTLVKESLQKNMDVREVSGLPQGWIFFTERK